MLVVSIEHEVACAYPERRLGTYPSRRPRNARVSVELAGRGEVPSRSRSRFQPEGLMPDPQPAVAGAKVAVGRVGPPCRRDSQRLVVADPLG